MLAAAVFGWTQLSEAKRLREEQTRPFVVIDLGASVPGVFDLVVRNIGSTMAYNVRFKFDPAIESTDNDLDPYKLKMFSEGISTLPPGKELRALFDSGDAREKSDLPDIYAVTVTYVDRKKRLPYEEIQDLDFGLYWDRLVHNRHDVHDIHRQLKLLVAEASKLRQTLSP